jgi:hypothetical protein
MDTNTNANTNANMSANMSANTNKKVEVEVEAEAEADVTKNDEDNIKFAYKPLNVSNVTYLDKHFYIERTDHRIRLVTKDYEMYY